MSVVNVIVNENMIQEWRKQSYFAGSAWIFYDKKVIYRQIQAVPGHYVLFE